MVFMVAFRPLVYLVQPFIPNIKVGITKMRAFVGSKTNNKN